ncbi:MAG: hypothetical protein NXY57DRAFT_1108538, partial [Lentinula lateritia]
GVFCIFISPLLLCYWLVIACEDVHSKGAEHVDFSFLSLTLLSVLCLRINCRITKQLQMEFNVVDKILNGLLYPTRIVPPFNWLCLFFL